MNTMQLTIWERPELTFHSQYGFVQYRRWCELELERLGRKVNATIKTYDGAQGWLTGMVAIFITR
jgi:hypothetical protein